MFGDRDRLRSSQNPGSDAGLAGQRAWTAGAAHNRPHHSRTRHTRARLRSSATIVIFSEGECDGRVVGALSFLSATRIEQVIGYVEPITGSSASSRWVIFSTCMTEAFTPASTRSTSGSMKSESAWPPNIDRLGGSAGARFMPAHRVERAPIEDSGTGRVTGRRSGGRPRSGAPVLTRR